MIVIFLCAELANKILPFYPKGKHDLLSNEIEVMLQMYLIQIWFNLSDEGLEDAIYGNYAMRNFVGINLGYVNSVTDTSANVHDIDEETKLIREGDDVIYGNSGYLGFPERLEIKNNENLS